MWRPNPRYSRRILWRKVKTDWDSPDGNGNPAQEREDVPVYAEVYSGTDPVSRQAFGLLREEALTIQLSGNLPGMEDLFVTGGKVFRPVSISEGDPVQVTAVYTGRKDGESDG